MYNVVDIPPNKLSPVETMSDLSHAVYQLFPDAYVDIDSDSNMVVIYTSLRYNQYDGSVTPQQKGITMMFYNGFNLMIDMVIVSLAAIYFRKMGRDDFTYDVEKELSFQYNEGWETGYETALRDKERNAVFRPVKQKGYTMRGIPTSACPMCGDRWLLVPVVFDDESYEITGYGTEASCYACGLELTAPTPLDHPNYEENWI